MIFVVGSRHRPAAAELAEMSISDPPSGGAIWGLRDPQEDPLQGTMPLRNRHETQICWGTCIVTHFINIKFGYVTAGDTCNRRVGAGGRWASKC